MERNDNDIFDELVRGKLSNYSEPPEPEWIHSIQYKKNRTVNLYHLYRFMLIGIIVGAGIVAGIMMTPAQLQVPTVQSQTEQNHPVQAQDGSTTDFASVVDANTGAVLPSTISSESHSDRSPANATGTQARSASPASSTPAPKATQTVQPKSSAVKQANQTSVIQPVKPKEGSQDLSNRGQISESTKDEDKVQTEQPEANVQSSDDQETETATPCKADFDFYTSYSGEFNFVHLSPIAKNADINWSFGDGTESTQRHSKHQFVHTGSYEVTLTVTDQNYTCSYSKTITYQNPNEKLSPIVLTGQVVAGSNLLRNAVVEVYAFNQEKGRFKSVQTVRTNQAGEYAIVLQRNTRYILRGYPTSEAPKYLATFWGNSIESEDATEIVVMPSEEEKLQGYTVKLMLDETEQEVTEIGNPIIPTANPQQVFLVDANNTIIGVGSVDANGNVSFGDDIPDGNYNIVDPATGTSTPTTISGGAKVSIGKGGTAGVNNGSASGINSHVTVYPNPASSVINFGISSSQEETATMVIMDAAGVERFRKQIIFNAGLNQNQYDLSNFSPGVYYLMIFRANKQVSSSRIVKLADDTK